MVLGRPRRSPAWAAALSVAALLIVVVVAVTRPDTDPEPAAGPEAERSQAKADAAASPPATPAPRLAQPVPGDTPVPGRVAVVTVAVANVWNEPGVARPVDAPSLTNPVDVRGWIAAMSHEDKLWLEERLVTQALYGEQVAVREVRGDWARVAVTGQPSSLDPEGYPGWIPTVQLRAGDPPDTGRTAVVTRPQAALRHADDPSRTLLELSFNTRLPVVAAGGGPDVTVALPNGGRGLLTAAEVDVSTGGPRSATGPELVRSAQLFSGLPYLWAGTSSAGFDCSGFTAAVYDVHGIVLPRDADDQAGKGTPVDRARFEPGDLLFYSTGPDQRSIHHVSMYVGDGMMIQAPATGKTVETVPVDTPQYARQFWGARRYLPPA
ncbi:MAG TPA: C40 family peptidase [Acidimicrobiales bacterium]|nr:C40 family peptidase [Acidimicrobiales bacterium]